MSASDLLQELQAIPADQPPDWPAISQRITAEFAQAATSEERGNVLAIRAAAMDQVMRQLQLSGDHLEKFIDACELEYKRLIVQETLVDSRVSIDLMLAVTDREIAAGRMSEDYALRELAKEESAAAHPEQVRSPNPTQSGGVGEENGRLAKIKNWLGIHK
jgi:hypothetical protein